MPLSSNATGQLIGRTLVTGALSYFFLSGSIVYPTLTSNIIVGATGAIGSMISEGYLEGSGQMLGSMMA